MRILGPDSEVAELAQGLLGEGADIEVVLDDEDPGPVPSASASGSSTGPAARDGPTRGR